VSDVELRLLQRLGEKDVEPAPTVDEYLVESRARDYWFQDEWKTPWLGEACCLTPKHPEALGRTIRRAPHGEAFIPDIKSWGGLLSW
jgi:hypothetical protein